LDPFLEKNKSDWMIRKIEDNLESYLNAREMERNKKIVEKNFIDINIKKFEDYR